MFVEVHKVGHDDWTTAARPQGQHVRRHRPELPGRRRRLELAVAAPVPDPLPDQDRCGVVHADGHRRGEWNAATGKLRRLGAVASWTSRRVRRQQVEVSITVAHRPGSLGPRRVGGRRQGHCRRRHVSEHRRSRTTTAAGRRPAARGHREPGERVGACAGVRSRRAASSERTTPSTPGSAFEDMDARTRPKFMGARDALPRRIRPSRTTAARRTPGGPPPKAYAAKFVQRLLKASKKGRVQGPPSATRRRCAPARARCGLRPQRQDAGQEGVQHRRRQVQAAHRAAVQVRQ